MVYSFVKKNYEQQKICSKFYEFMIILRKVESFIIVMK